ncbi:hypothetical protein GGF41_001814 [Coemansia sp. RSA 2531]|nr:hypothetical protein GGF41_001814 [Coemansia sp. RSA 2531]
MPHLPLLLQLGAVDRPTPAPLVRLSPITGCQSPTCRCSQQRLNMIRGLCHTSIDLLRHRYQSMVVIALHWPCIFRSSIAHRYTMASNCRRSTCTLQLLIIVSQPATHRHGVRRIRNYSISNNCCPRKRMQRAALVVAATIRLDIIPS